MRWRSPFCPWKSSCQGGTRKYGKRNGLLRLAWAYRRLSESVRFLARLTILSYDEQAMQRFEQLRKQKIKIGRTDLRIAATVLEHGATLVTENVRDFKQVPGLKIVSWSGR